MAVNAGLRIGLTRAFDDLHRLLNRPALYAYPWQTPAGLTYDADVDAWVSGAGAAPDPDLYSLTYYAVPALWGPNAEALTLALGGVVATGDQVAIAKAEYQPRLAGAMMVITGSPTTGEKFTLVGLDNAPDGGAAIFVVANLKRREQ